MADKKPETPLKELASHTKFLPLPGGSLPKIREEKELEELQRSLNSYHKSMKKLRDYYWLL